MVSLGHNSKRTFLVPTGHGRSIQLTNLEWDHQALHEVRHACERSHPVGAQDRSCLAAQGHVLAHHPIQLSDEDRLYAMVRSRRATLGRTSGWLQYAQPLRHICNNPRPYTARISRQGGQRGGPVPRRYYVGTAPSWKSWWSNQRASATRATRWWCSPAGSTPQPGTSSPQELTKRKINHVIHHGGMDRPVAQAAQDEFKRNPR